MALKSWGNTNAPTGNTTARMDWRNLETNAPWKIRLVGDLLPNYVYWVKTRDGNRTRSICNFNRETEKFDTTIDDPIGRIVGPKEFDFKPSFAYATKVIDRKDGEVKVLELNKVTLYREIVRLASNPDWGDPADPVSGYDLTIEKIKTGPLKQNVKYTATPSRSCTPLTDEEKEKIENCGIDLEKIYKIDTPEEQIAWLKEHTSYVTDADGLSDDDDDVPF